MVEAAVVPSFWALCRRRCRRPLPPLPLPSLVSPPLPGRRRTLGVTKTAKGDDAEAARPRPDATHPVERGAKGEQDEQGGGWAPDSPEGRGSLPLSLRSRTPVALPPL